MGTRTLAILLLASLPAYGENWPRWRGPDGNPVSSEVLLPITWSATENVRWKTPLPGEGISSPIVWDDWVFITSAEQKGARRYLHGLNRKSGKIIWSQGLENPNPERTTAVVGHAASTPVTDGAYVVAYFGNGGIVCCNLDGKPQWHRQTPDFECQDGIVNSPIILGDMVILVCDHRGHKPTSFNSSMIALDKRTGKEIWKSERPAQERSWSTPIVVPAPNLKKQLVVASQKDVRAYDPLTGKQLWEIDSGADWINPTPVYGLDNLVIAGKGAPFLGINLDQKWKAEKIIELANPEKIEKDKQPEKDEKPEQPLYLWKQAPKEPNYCSPLLMKNLLFLVSEDGFVACFDVLLKIPYFKERLPGKFTASPVLGNGMLYITNETGTTYVLKAESKFELLATNKLGEPTWSVPAISHHCLFFRTDKNLWCIERGEMK